MMDMQPDASSPQEWSSDLRRFVEGDYQEPQYRLLAEALKLDSDPKKAPIKAYEYLARGPMPLAYALDQNLQQLRMDPFFSSKAYAHLSGTPLSQELQEPTTEDFFTAEELQDFKRRVEDAYGHYFSLKPPTCYEDLDRYVSMLISFDTIQEALTRQGYTSLQRLFVATLPSSDVNALAATEPYSGDRVLFFQQGLFQFLTDFARLIGGISLPLTPQQLSSDIALAGSPWRYTMPLSASQFFQGLLTGYVIEGTPLGNPYPPPNPTHNMFTTVLLAGGMKNFVMAHELAHLVLGHKGQARELEHEADTFGAALLIKSYQQAGVSRAIGFWACDLALTALHFLYRTLGILEFGPVKLHWKSPTHPDPFSRRARLHEGLDQVISDPSQFELAGVGELCGMTDALLQNLWEFCSAILVSSYQQGTGPSPMWKEGIRQNISPSN